MDGVLFVAERGRDRMTKARKGDLAPELDPALRVGDTVGVLASDALLAAARFLDTVESDDASAAETLAGNARMCRTLAEAVARAPLGSCRRIVGPDDLGGRFFTLTEQTWSNAEVAVFLLADTARIMEMLPAIDGALKNRLLRDAQGLRRVEALIRLAPNATLGPRLDALTPLLRTLERPREGERPFPPMLIDGTTSDPEFWETAQDVYRIIVGRELDDLPAQAQAVWSGKLAVAWHRLRDRARPLSQAQVQQIDDAARHPSGPWSRPPLIPGDWTELEPEAAASVLRLIATRFHLGPSSTPLPLAAFCDRVRTCPARCYGDAVLVEVQGRLVGGTSGIATFLITEDDIHGADGASAWIHDLNETRGVRLTDEEARLEYVRLFMNLVRNDDERFQLAESFQVMADRAEDAETLRALCIDHTAPPAPAGFDEEGRWRFVATIAYGGALFVAVLALRPDGLLEMTDDEMLVEDVRLRRERMDGLFVVLEPKGEVE